MTSPSVIWHLDARRLGRRVLVFDELDSTNTFAAQLAEDVANDGVIVLADRQTRGRGQHGRSWQSPPGRSVLLSVLCFPPLALRRAAVLTAWAAVAVCDTVRQATEARAKIKWPNDVLLQGRKVCGILTEQGRGTVIGMGLNVNQSADDFAAAGLPQATSLALQAGRPFNCHDVARLLIQHLDEAYDQLVAGDLSTLEESWRWRVGLVGQRVAVECADGVVRGRLLEMAFDGLLLDLGGGETRLFVPELAWHVAPL